MNIRFSLSSALASVLFLLAGSAPAQESSPHKIKMLTILGRPLEVSVAEQRGTFKKYGIELETENLSNSDTLRANLAAGKGDVAYLAADNAVAMVELAHQDVIIVMGGEGSQNELMVQPEIKTIKDLSGKTLIVDAPNTAYALQLREILSLSGLQVTRDYELKPVGPTPQRLVAMRQDKSYSGSMLGPPTSIIAKHEGFLSLGSVPQLVGAYQSQCVFTPRPWAHDHRDSLVSLVAAMIEAQRWLMDAANKQQVIELMTKEAHLTPEVAAETYESVMTRPGGFEKDALFDLDGFQNVLNLRAKMGGQWDGHPPSTEKYYDPSYYNQALATLRKME